MLLKSEMKEFFLVKFIPPSLKVLWEEIEIVCRVTEGSTENRSHSQTHAGI